MFSFDFFATNILLGAGLAMDAFSASLANGLNEPTIKKAKIFGIAGIFAFFQALMPILGWICVHTLLQYFTAFEKFIPWIALALLGFIGAKMLIDGIKTNKEDDPQPTSGVKLGTLFLQGIATSIDALSVGFTIAEYNITQALVAVLLIAIVTFGICIAGIFIGKKFGTKLAGKASIFGGAILILIGIEIFVTSFF